MQKNEKQKFTEPERKSKDEHERALRSDSSLYCYRKGIFGVFCSAFGLCTTEKSSMVTIDEYVSQIMLR